MSTNAMSTNETTGSTHWIGDSDLGERFPSWTRGNAADVFPEPFSILGQDLALKQGMSRGLRDAYIWIGVFDYDEFENPEQPDLFKVFGGYVYNPLTMTRVLGARMPGRDARADRQGVLRRARRRPSVRAAGLARVAQARGAPRRVDGVGDVGDRAARPRRRPGAVRPAARGPTRPVDADRLGAARPSPGDGALPAAGVRERDAGVVAGVARPRRDRRDLRGSATRRWPSGCSPASRSTPRTVTRDVGAGAPGTPERRRHGAFEAGPDAVLDQLRASDDPAAVDYLERFEQFLFDHGARGQNEYDVRAASWEVTPDRARGDRPDAQVRRSAGSGGPSPAVGAERDRLVAEIRDKVAGDAETAGTFEAALSRRRCSSSGRERAKTNVVRVINEMRSHSVSTAGASSSAASSRGRSRCSWSPTPSSTDSARLPNRSRR
jgi:hypothetical protein